MAPEKTADKPGAEFIDDDAGWEIIKQESGEQITFEKVGDTFTGTYKGMTVIEFTDAKEGPKSFNQYAFTGIDGKAYAINGGYQLDEAMPEVPEGSLVKITLMALVKTDQPSPLKDYNIQIRRPS